jgi:hydrogenase nickel incorporation protein HypA/HybF
MHEWALAEAVLDSVRGEAAGRRVLRVVLRLGELQRIDPEVFLGGLQTLAAGTPLEAAAFPIETEPARLACLACGREWSLRELSLEDEEQKEAIHFLPEALHAYLRCPGCGSPDLRVKSGRGLTIASIELEDSGPGEPPA